MSSDMVSAIFDRPDRTVQGIRYSFFWGRHLFGTNARVNMACDSLKGATYIYNWLFVDDIVKSVKQGICRAKRKWREWSTLPSNERESTLTHATQVFVEDLSGPTYEVGYIAACTLDSSPIELRRIAPFSFGIASTAAILGASANLYNVAQDYLSEQPSEEKRSLLIKAAKYISTLAIGVLGLASLFFGELYATISLIGVSVLYTIGIYEDAIRPEEKELPPFTPSY